MPVTAVATAPAPASGGLGVSNSIRHFLELDAHGGDPSPQLIPRPSLGNRSLKSLPIPPPEPFPEPLPDPVSPIRLS
ncbi:hypothetical protein D3C78_1790300 [compost metagenome]